MLDWNDYHQQIQAGIAEIGRANPDIVRGYRGLSESGAKTDLLGAKTRELIALAVAVTRQCDGCIVTHTDGAIKQGASREEIIEALSVAVTVNAGAALILLRGPSTPSRQKNRLKPSSRHRRVIFDKSVVPD